ncbi:dystrophin [Artemisia annua]|uniref:Dystrophin n=1 Tax=Artemisia annua TaxID=35608 RepID=A0A2U1M8G8_ARTAN|nr:dystrophin [Artemisia annua]
MMTDDEQVSRDERCFRLWIASLGISSHVNNVFEDLRNGWILLEILDKVALGTVNWKQTTKPPIKMPFRKVENCNQAVRIGKHLRFSLVNIQGNDIVQGNKKLILAFLWQLMRNRQWKLHLIYKEYKTKEEAMTHPPQGIDVSDWVKLCERFASEKFQKISIKNKKNRAKNEIPPTVGSHSLARTVDTSRKAGKEVPESKQWRMARYSEERKQ